MNAQTATTYRNPWHKADEAMYGPAFYTTAAKPVTVDGFQIFERIKGRCWDVVKDGVCVTQRAGPTGARQFIAEAMKTKRIPKGRRHNAEAHA